MKKIVCIFLCLSLALTMALPTFAIDYEEINDPARLPWNIYGNPVVESENTTRYAPWFVQYQMQTADEVGLRAGGEGGQVITAICSAPSNPDYLLMSTDVAGAQYSHDGGKHWFKVREGDATWSSSSFIFDPYDANICYSAQGWRGASSSYTNKAGKSSINGLYKSTDGGITWKMVYDCAFVNGSGENLLAFDQNHNLYALTTEGVIKSADGGNKWQKLGSADTISYVESMAVSKDGKKIVCAVSGGNALGISASLDGGTTWSLKNPVKDKSATGVAMDPLDNSHWVAICGGIVYETHNNGESWDVMEVDVSAGMKKGNPTRIEFAKKASANGIPNLYIRCSNVPYPLRVSHDYGKTWVTPFVYCEDMLLDNNNGWTQEGMWCDDTNPDVIYGAFWDVLYKSENGGDDYFPCSSGSTATGLTWAHFAKDGRVWYGFRDKNLAVSNETYNGGKLPTLRSLHNYPRHGTAKSCESVITDVNDSNHILAYIGGWQNQQLEESFDGGESFENINGIVCEGDNIVFQYHNKNDKMIYSTSYTSYDNGKTWERNSKDIVAVSPVNNDVVFSYDTEAREAFISYNCGKDWKSIGKTTLVAACYCADSLNEETMYLGTQSHALVKFTAGEEPKNIGFADKYNNQGDIITAITFNPNNPDHMIIGCRNSGEGSRSIGMFESYDHGETFHVVTGFPGLRYITDFNWDPYTNNLWVGTYGGTYIYEWQNFKKFYEERITVVLNGKKVYFDVDPETVNDRTFVPMRKIFELLGADISWEDATETVTAVKGDTTIKLKIGSKDASINGKTYNLDAAPYVTCDRTLVPLRFVAESLNGNVKWDEDTKTATIDASVTQKKQTANDEGIYKLNPTDDTYIYYAKLPYSDDYGASGTMYVKNYSGMKNWAEDYFKFDLSVVEGKVVSATLYIKVKSKRAEVDQEIGVYAVENDKWTEKNFKDNDKLLLSLPTNDRYVFTGDRIIPFGNLLEKAMITERNGQWISFDITGYVMQELQKDKVASFGLSLLESNSTLVEIYSKEITDASARPYLEIQIQK